MNLPEGFLDSIRPLLGGDEEAFCRSLDDEPATAVRYNPFKMEHAPGGVQVPWCRYGRILERRPQFTLDPLFHAGVYYVQEASSMFVEHVCRAACGEGGPLRILDLCAAPGGKATLMSTLAGLDGLVVANEVIRPRANVLADNVMRWGLGNVAVTCNDPSAFAAFRDYFDVVLADVPCSGEGMFRKDPAAAAEWSPANVQLCAGRQRRIVGEVWDALKPGGILIYSTCTFNTKENEENMEWLAGRHDCEAVDVAVPADWPVERGSVRGIGTFRFFPHKSIGEGFFAAVVRKSPGKVGGRIHTKVPSPRRDALADAARDEVRELSRWVAQPGVMTFGRVGDNYYGYYTAAWREVRMLAAALGVVYSGVAMGQMFSGKLKPAHALALFHDVARGVVPAHDLALPDALDYLRRRDLPAAFFDEGLNMVTYDGHPIGWIKRIGNRCNNMYPNELRIRNL